MAFYPGKYRPAPLLAGGSREFAPYLECCQEPKALVDWPDKEKVSRPEGYFSIYDTRGEAQADPAAPAVLAPIQEKAVVSERKGFPPCAATHSGRKIILFLA